VYISVFICLCPLKLVFASNPSVRYQREGLGYLPHGRAQDHERRISVAERGGPSYPGIMKWRRDGGESASTVEGILGLICVLKEEIRCESGLVEVIRRSSVAWKSWVSPWFEHGPSMMEDTTLFNCFLEFSMKGFSRH
jgi:hypothetical protein